MAQGSAASPKSASAAALRDKLAASRKAVDRERVEVTLGTETVTVEMRSMLFAERTTLLREGFVDEDATRTNPETFFPLVIVFSAHDPESGERLFEKSDEDLAFVRTLPQGVVETLATSGLRVSGLSKQAADAVGNGSGSMASDSSSSPSPASSVG